MPTRARWQYPFRSLAAAGAALAAGSDWPVSGLDPVLGLHVAVNRVAPGGPGEVLIPEERLGLADALAAHTSGAARVNHDDAGGRIAAGMRADLVVLDRDPFDGPAGEICQIRVAANFVAGEAVFQAER